LQIIWPSVGVALSESRALLQQASAGQVDHALARQIACSLLAARATQPSSEQMHSHEQGGEHEPT